MHDHQSFQDEAENSVIPSIDSNQLSEVVSCYSGMFFRRAYRYLHNEQDAEDVVQEALLSAHRNLSQFKGNSRLSTWVMAIVINSARQHFRRRPSCTFVQIDISPDEQEFVAIDLRDPCANPEEMFSDAEQRSRLLQTVARLPPSYQKVYRMRDLEGKTTAQVAQALRISEGTVKGYLSRARIKLGRLLRDSRHLNCHKPGRAA